MHGHPNHVTSFSNRNHAAVFGMESKTGVVFSHLVKYFVAVIMYLVLDLLADGLTGPTNYITHL
jgi:hypothetical protein